MCLIEMNHAKARSDQMLKTAQLNIAQLPDTHAAELTWDFSIQLRLISKLTRGARSKVGSSNAADASGSNPLRAESQRRRQLAIRTGFTVDTSDADP
jgi:hypothetical protein